jgi:hypothetical protein
MIRTLLALLTASAVAQPIGPVPTTTNWSLASSGRRLQCRSA